MVLPILKLRGKRDALHSREMHKALEYIDSQWPVLTMSQIEDEGTLIGLPRPFVVPAADENAFFTFKEQYYWDSYFVAIGLLRDDQQELVEGMLENLLHLLRRFGMIPNASRMYFMTHSQPPILTTYIFYVYDRYGKSKEWLQERMAMAELEYSTVWMSSKHPYWHLVHKGLNRFYDIHNLHDLAEAESGWDMTTRFERKCLDYLPVDLNSLLYKYETDFERFYEIMDDEHTAKAWHRRARMRKDAMNGLMWGKLRGFYFDYNYNKQELGGVWSLASYYTMWAGLASREQAARMVDNLSKFEKTGGLTTTTRPLIDLNIFGSLKTQWAYPNGWAPLHYIVIEGLKRYGYEEEAERIAHKWLKTNLTWYARHHTFREQYNVVNPFKPPVEGVYPQQNSGFGWTNAVFLRLATEYNLL
jgi:alpha,alpha-trehalase